MTVLVKSGTAQEVDVAFDPIGSSHTSNSSLSGVVTLTPADGPYGHAQRILIQSFTQNVRYTLDGSTPSATVGFRLTAGNDPILITLTAGMTIKLIEETASANIQYEWCK